MSGYAGWYSLQLLNAIKFEWDVKYFLLSYIPVVLFGGWSCVLLTVYSYMSNNSTKEHRFLKFALFELANFIGGPTGVYLGGILLGRGNYNANGNIHFYERTFIFSVIGSITALFWVMFVINENKSTNNNKSEEIEMNAKTIEEKPNHKELQTKQMNEKFKLSKMFDIKNLRELLRTATKLRPNNGRAKIWLLYLSNCVLILSDVRFFSILFPYIERVVGWDAKQISDIKSVASIVQVLSTALITAVFSSYLKLSDTILGIIGFISLFMADVCVSSIIDPIGIYLMYAIASPSAITSLAIRALLSKIAPESESGKIFAVLGALEQVFPSIQVLLYNYLFEYTIDFYPSLCFQMATAFNFFPLFVLISIDLNQNQINSTKL